MAEEPGGGGYRPIDDLTELEEGDRVVVEGHRAEMPWQHMVEPLDTHPCVDYLDVDGDQVVLYSTEPIRAPGRVRVRGTVIRLEGRSKRPGADEAVRYVEHQIRVDAWERLDRDTPKENEAHP